MNKNIFYDPVSKVWSGPPLKPLYNVDGNLGDIILRRLIQTPDNVFQISDDTKAQLTNYDIYVRSIKFANHLSKLGVKQNDIVGLIALNSENVAPIIFACFILGAAVNPLSILMSDKDISYHWSKIKPKVVFCDARNFPIVSKAFVEMDSKAKIYTLIERIDGIPFADDILSEPFNVDDFEFPDLPNISSSTALIMCSSGTTGMPKGICKTHKQILTTYYPFFKQNPVVQDVCFCSVTSYWISHPLFLITSALYGAKFVITKMPASPDLWMDIIDRYKVSIVFSVPAFIAVLLKSNKIRKLESLRTVVFAGCPIPPKFFEKVKPLIPNGEIFCCYGSTESDIITNTALSGLKGTSSGFPSKNYKLKIMDDNGNPVGPNETGEIYYKMPVEFPGYFNDPENTGQSLDGDKFIKSGDLGYFDDEGHLFVIDRIKHLIKSKEGYRVTPAEIETIIDEIHGVLQSCVVGVEDREQFIDFIYAFVIKNPLREGITEDFIMNHVNGQVIDAKKISRVIFVDKFPMTASGKIINRELREIAKRYHEQATFKDEGPILSCQQNLKQVEVNFANIQKSLA